MCQLPICCPALNHVNKNLNYVKVVAAKALNSHLKIKKDKMKKLFLSTLLYVMLASISTTFAQTFNYDAGFDSLVISKQIEPTNGLSEWPMYHNSTVSFGGRIYNYGIMDFDTVTVHLMVMDDNMITLHDTTIMIDFTGITTVIFLNYAIGAFVAQAKGTYHVHCGTMIKNFVDENVLNDSAFAFFDVVDSTFAHDYTIYMPATSLQGVNAPGQHSKMVQKYVLNKTDVMTAVTIKLNAPDFGDSTQAFIYRIDSATQYPDTILIAESDKYFFTANDTLGETTITLHFPNGGVSLPPDVYAIGVYEFNYSINLMASNRVFKDFTNFIYYDSLYGWGRIEQFNVFESYAIHPEFGCTMVLTSTTTSTICSNSSGSASVAYAGNSGNVTFLWSNGATVDNITGVAAGTYTCTVSDEGGCAIPFVVTIADLAAPVIDSVVTTPDNGTNNGSAVCFVTSQSTPLTFVWSNGSTGNPVSNLAAATYTVIVTDINGCTKVGIVVIPSSASVDQLFNNFGIKIFYNANEQLLSINGAWYANNNITIKILDLAGKAVYSDSFLNTVSLNTNISTAGFAKGTYFINVQVGDKSSTNKIVLN